MAIEHRLMEHPAVLEAVAVGKADALRGESVKAFVVLKPGFVPSEELEGQLARSVESSLSIYAYPRELEFVTGLPRTASGQIERGRLGSGRPRGVL